LLEPALTQRDLWGLKKLNAQKFAESIREYLLPEAKGKAAELAKSISVEGDGMETMVNSFHAHLPLEGEHSMRCSIFEDRVAVWTVKHTKTIYLHWLQISSSSQDICGGTISNSKSITNGMTSRDLAGRSQVLGAHSSPRSMKPSSDYPVYLGKPGGTRKFGKDSSRRGTENSRRRNGTVWSNYPSAFGSAWSLGEHRERQLAR
jgi:hypothetical protein